MICHLKNVAAFCTFLTTRKPHLKEISDPPLGWEKNLIHQSEFLCETAN